MTNFIQKLDPFIKDLKIAPQISDLIFDLGHATNMPRNKVGPEIGWNAPPSAWIVIYKL